MVRVLAISSQVACGHVGLSAIVPVLQGLGHDVVALPTVLLSNHPGHSNVAGERMAPEHLRRMLDALAANGWLGGIDAVLTGYLPSPEHVRFAADAVREVRQANPRAIVLVDPVLGDDPNGLYIDVRAAEAIKRELMALADVIKLNAFELGWLSGQRIRSSGDAVAAVQAMRWPLTIATSVPAGTGMILNLLIEAGGVIGGGLACKLLPAVPKGTGDLFSALLLGHMLADGASNDDAFIRACAGVWLAARESVGEPELALVRHLRAIADATVYQLEGAP